MNAKLIVLTQRQLMLDRVFEITLDIQIGILAGDHPADCADLKQHSLKIEKAVAAKDRFPMAGKDPMKIAGREFMSKLRQTAFASLFGGGIRWLEGHKDLTHHELLHLPDAVDDLIFTNRKWIQTLRKAGFLENGIQQHDEVAGQQLGMPEDIGHRILLEPGLIRDSFR